MQCPSFGVQQANVDCVCVRVAVLQDYFPYSHAALFMPPILFLYLEVSESPICHHNVHVRRTLTVIPVGPLLGTAWHGRQRSPRF